MLTFRASASVEPGRRPLAPNSGAAVLLSGCRIWQGLPLGASSGSAVFDTCSLGAVSIEEQQPWSSYVTDDYFLVFADMCGDGEVITEINAAPSNGGWAGLEVREDTASSARKYGMRTQTGTAVQLFTRSTSGQAASFSSFIKPPHKIQICVEIANSCECAPASVDVALTSPSSPHLASYTTQNLAFTDSSTQQCFTIVLADTAATASYTFSLQNVSGGNNGQAGSVGQLNLSVVSSTGSFCGAATPPPVDSSVVAGNVDTLTHEFVIAPGITADYALRRTISGFGGLPNDFALCTETDTVTVTVLQAPPSPGFSFTMDEDNCTVQFISQDTTGAHLWDFGDANNSSEVNPLHHYSGSGPFSVVHTVRNECGSFDTTQIVDINCCIAPDATFTISIDTCSRTVNFTSALGQEANYHRWEFGDAANTTAGGPGLAAASFTYPAAGAYTAGHAVDELACGESDFATVTFTIPSLPPLGDPTQVFATHLECGEVEFQLRDSLGGALSFGDGSSAIADTAYIYHTYASLADYTATYVLDNGCEQDSFSLAVPLAQYAPQAQAILDGVFCLGVVVSGRDTAAGHSYQWQFGASGTAIGAQAAFTFDSAGLYDVILAVSDTCGNSAADTLQVAVEDCEEALSCPCANGVNIVADSANGTRLSTLTALGILPPGLLSNSCLAVSGLLLVDEGYEISGGEVYMHPGSEILVRPDGPEITFAVSGMEQTTGIQGCGQMWKGIRIEDSRLVLKGARVADARFAVHARNKAKVLVDASYFNRNFASLYFSGSGSESFSLEAFLATEVLGYQSLLPPFAGQSPAPGGRPYAGIEIHNDPSLKSIGSTGGAANRFDGLRNGILTENTPLAVHNSSFTDIVEATSEPYPLSGFGIRHSGGAAHPLLQRGSGNSPSSAVSFRNCAQAIRVEGTTADIAANNMVECKNGVRVQLAQNRNVLVHDNLMDVSTIGIELLQNAPLEALEVEGNTITTKRRGIAVEETGIAFADATVRFNTVTLQGKGYGIRLNSVNGLEASNNGIFLGQAVQPAEGILVSNATDCVVRENTVDGAGGDNLGVAGLKVWDSGHTVFDCNTFTGLGTGAEFRGACIGSTVSTNTFHPGAAGMGRGLVYNPNLNIGVQSHAGNLWEVNGGLPNEGYGVAAGVNYVLESEFDEIPLNNFIVNSVDFPVKPSSVSFPNLPTVFWGQAELDWFPIDVNGVSEVCTLGGIVEPDNPKDIHRKVARGELQDSLYQEAMLWAAQLQMYKQLAEAVEWSSDEVLDSFYLANANTAIAQYYLLEKAKEELFQYDSLQGATLNSLEAQLQELIGHILEKDSLIAVGTMGLEASRDSLLDEVRVLCISLDSLENVLLQSRLVLAQQALTDNVALSDTAVYQKNEKALNAVFLGTPAQGSSTFSLQDEESLLSIASQCPLSNGRAVHYARSLYQLVEDKDFEDNCEGLENLREHSTPWAIFEQKLVDSIRVFPNPASNELFLEGRCDQFQLINQLGQPVLAQQLFPEDNMHAIKLPELPDGIYFLKISYAGNLVALRKVMISD